MLPNIASVQATSANFLAVYLALWGIFTLFMFIGTLKANRVLQFVFASLTVLFALLAIGNLYENKTILTIAGFEGIICGASALPCYG